MTKAIIKSAGHADVTFKRVDINVEQINYLVESESTVKFLGEDVHIVEYGDRLKKLDTLISLVKVSRLNSEDKKYLYNRFAYYLLNPKVEFNDNRVLALLKVVGSFSLSVFSNLIATRTEEMISNFLEYFKS